jgi:NADP-dependent 3-hydroxy acid dehydrogenase YdfG
MNFRWALITGATSGIGEATAFELAAHGINLIVTGRRLERLKKLKSEIELKNKVKVITHILDVRDAKAVQELEKITELEEVDVLINNAGLAVGTERVAQAKLSDWDTMIDTNVKGLLYVTRTVLPFMLRRGQGHVVNVGSVAGRWVYPGGAVYCASKFAVRALSEGIRMDLNGSPIRVSNIEPGMVSTEFSEVRFGDHEKAKAVYKGMTPLKAKDIAETVYW